VIYSVNHTTRYEFSGPVFLEPHILRLFPRCDGTQRIIEHQLEIVPAPAGFSRGLDLWGNSFALAWFEGLHSSLLIESYLGIKTLRDNPFDFYLPEGSTTLPISLGPHEREALGSSLKRMSGAGNNADLVSSTADSCLKSSQGDTLAFLASVNTWIAGNIQRVERSEPGIIDPLDLLRHGKGSCRDLAALFMDMCRVCGIPSRLVSGYQEGDPEVYEAELHAWAEVYLPGAGWRGYDPTHGLAASDRHIPLAAAPEPENTMPVSGTYRGTDITSQIRHRVTMAADPAQPQGLT